jgi:CspA family cold shock protein
MPSGTVKWFDADKGFGFIAGEDGHEVFVHVSSLDPGVTLRQGARVEFGVVDGRRGKQALSVRVLDSAASVTKARRRPPEEMTPVVEDLIKLLDGVGSQLRAGRYPDDVKAAKTARLLRAVADQLDV